MIKANYDEEFTLTASVIDEGVGMVSGLTVDYEIWTENEATLVDSGTMWESATVSGIYLFTTYITEAEYNNYGTLYRVYYKTPSGYTDGADDIMIYDDLYKLVEQNRHYNLAVENVLAYSADIVPAQNPRNLSDNVTNFVKTKIKAEKDANWDSAAVHYVYAWYETAGDKIPYKMDKRDPSEPSFPHYTGEA
jgi:hypothetical protein